MHILGWLILLLLTFSQMHSLKGTGSSSLLVNLFGCKNGNTLTILKRESYWKNIGIFHRIQWQDVSTILET